MAIPKMMAAFNFRSPCPSLDETAKGSGTPDGATDGLEGRP
jgi:hypothetical protein